MNIHLTEIEIESLQMILETFIDESTPDDVINYEEVKMARHLKTIADEILAKISFFSDDYDKEE